MSKVSMAAPADSVILLHGLARTEKSMGRLRRALERHGYHVINVGYDSRKSNIATLAEAAIAPALEACAEGVRVHFVTHSMGGILLRQFLRHHTIQNLGSVVMLGPPNKGSEVVDRLREVPGFRLLHGDAGLELGTGTDSLPKSLGPANFDLGVIPIPAQGVHRERDYPAPHGGQTGGGDAQRVIRSRGADAQLVVVVPAATPLGIRELYEVGAGLG